MKDRNFQHHENNTKSVLLKVQSLKKEKYNPVLLYKPQHPIDESMSKTFHKENFYIWKSE